MINLPEGGSFVCGSAAMKRIHAQAAVIAKFDMPVLMLGESGTGKEVISLLIHHLSPRANFPFLKVNCAAVPAELLESELFGYEVGAFTGATKSKPGKFELCEQGTILLDEIGEMPPALQAKLLHFLQDHRFSRLGSRTTTKADVRILAATNIRVEEALASKMLREDLYYRLSGFTLADTSTAGKEKRDSGAAGALHAAQCSPVFQPGAQVQSEADPGLFKLLVAGQSAPAGKLRATLSGSRR